MAHPRVSHEEWLARFDGYLHQQGYRARTIRRYHTVCQQFLQYLDAQAIALEQVDQQPDQCGQQAKRNQAADEADALRDR